MKGYLLRTEGGPCDGQTRVVPPEWGWPLPDRLAPPFGDSSGGCYLKVSESQLPPEVDESPHLARGAHYLWHPDPVPE